MRFGKLDIVNIEEYYEKSCVDYRNHGPGRVVSGGIFIGKGLRGAWHHPAVVVVQHGED